MIILSIGHSSHDWPTFRGLLDQAEIGVIVDVRSNPASRLPHFNRTALKERLNAAGVGYVFLGVELGGRPRNGGVPDYEKMATSQVFAEGIARVEEMAARTRPALMCSEHEPLTCHRCLLVGRRLVERGNSLAHILRDGTIQPSEVTENRLLALTRQTEGDLLASRDERLRTAYRLQTLRIGRTRR
ncbi:MAG: DUF488 domain-containing protein [Roseiarcus sp.]|jgi:uncharacterized protein (DUF488 family)